MADQAQEMWGRKVFFLYPHPIIHEELLQSILANEYEVYLVKDHVRLLPILRTCPDSLLFLNADAEVRGFDGVDYVRSIMTSEEMKGTKVAVISYREDNRLGRVFVNELRVQGGFVHLRPSIEECKNLLLKVLKENEVIGKRKFVRARCDARASFNARYGMSFHPGTVKDVSSAGFAGSFDAGFRLEVETRLGDIQLNLRGRLLRVQGTIVAKRQEEGGRELYVILFDRETPAETKLKLRLFIHAVLQAELEARMAEILGESPATSR